MKIFGKHAVRSAFKSGRFIQTLWLSDTLKPSISQEFQQLAKVYHTRVQVVPSQKINSMCLGENTQGIVAEVTAYSFTAWETFLEKAVNSPEVFFLFLDRIQDPHNLGAILRTADAVGIDGVIIPKHESVSLTEGVAKASAGAIERVPVAQVTNLIPCIQSLKEQNVWIAGFDTQASQEYTQADLTGSISLVIGAEHEGLRAGIKKQCDFLLHIPMHSHTASLNASVASALAMYEVVRQRNLTLKEPS